MSSQSPSVLRGTNHPRWFAPVAVAAAVAGLAGGFVGFDATQNEPLKTTQAAAGFGALACGVLAAIGLGVATRREFVVDGEGVEARRVGGKSLRIEWHEDHAFFYRDVTGSGMPEVDKVRVRTPDGRQIDVDHVAVPGQANARVPKVVEQFSTAANWPKIQARIEAGEQIDFGAIQMSREQIRVGGHEHSLSKRVTLQIEAGKIKIGTEGKWVTTEVRADEVANYPCLLKAIGQVGQALPPG